jgi:hypothetical protein
MFWFNLLLYKLLVCYLVQLTLVVFVSYTQVEFKFESLQGGSFFLKKNCRMVMDIIICIGKIFYAIIFYII